MGFFSAPPSDGKTPNQKKYEAAKASYKAQRKQALAEDFKAFQDAHYAKKLEKWESCKQKSSPKPRNF